MSTNKTVPTHASPHDFIKGVENEKKKKDAVRILQIMEEETGEQAIMWGESIIGFGAYHYKYASGREGDFLRVGFSPRKQNFSLYLLCGGDLLSEELKRFGKHKMGKACIYIKKLDDINEEVLREMIRKSYHHFD